VEIDRGQIEQALLNLYVNAGQAMHEGGELFLQTENVLFDGTYVQPYKVDPGNYVKVSISDTGVGIDKKTQDRIFEPFFTTKGKKGTGLGLSIVKTIIEAHRGTIICQSQINKGTTFILNFPFH